MKRHDLAWPMRESDPEPYTLKDFLRVFLGLVVVLVELLALLGLVFLAGGPQ